MNEWKEAIPAGYYLEPDHPGRVYRAETKGPPMQVRECYDWETGDGIAIEYEDMVERAKEEMGLPADPTVRLLLQVSDARFLTVALIEALSGGGDIVALRLKKVLDDFYEEQNQKNGE